MRCPFCGGINTDTAQFCVRCGREFTQLTPIASQQYPQIEPQRFVPRPPKNAPPKPPPPYQPTKAVTPRPAPLSPPAQKSASPVVKQVEARIEEPETPASQAPTAFPPRTVVHLKELMVEALPYTLVKETVADGRRKIIVIEYGRCPQWKQIATLYKALQDQKAVVYDSVIIQGMSDQSNNMYVGFNNGQLQYSRNVRLGSELLERYIFETGNGFSSDSLRIVLTV